MRIFVTRSILEAGVTLLQREAEVEIWPGPDDDVPSKEEVLRGVRRADVLLCLLTETIDRTVMEANPKLLGIANHAVGFNNIELKTATELGLPITNTPGVLTDTTADLTWALILAVARHIAQGHQYTKQRRFKAWDPNFSLEGM